MDNGDNVKVELEPSVITGRVPTASSTSREEIYKITRIAVYALGYFFPKITQEILYSYQTSRKSKHGEAR